MKYLVITGADDDGLDTDLGYRGTIQFVLRHAARHEQRRLDDRGRFERQRGRAAAPIYARLQRHLHPAQRGAGPQRPAVPRRHRLCAAEHGGGRDAAGTNCLDIDETGGTTTRAADAALQDLGAPVFRSVVFACTNPYTNDGNVTVAAVQAIFGAGTNNNNDSFASTLTNVFINGAERDGGGGDRSDAVQRRPSIGAAAERRRAEPAGRRSPISARCATRPTPGMRRLDLQFQLRELRRTAVLHRHPDDLIAADDGRGRRHAPPLIGMCMPDRGDSDATVDHDLGSACSSASALVAPAALAQAPAQRPRPGGAAGRRRAPTAPPSAADSRRRREPEERSKSRHRAPARAQVRTSSSPARVLRTVVRATPQVVSVLSRRGHRPHRRGRHRRRADSASPASAWSATASSTSAGSATAIRSALLNGSPLPSPEPLRRVVPLDIFPTSVIASSLVQKSYSVNYPGEFGGGVINLTTPAVPREAFLNVGASASAATARRPAISAIPIIGSDTDCSASTTARATSRRRCARAMAGGTFNADDARPSGATSPPA